MFRFIFSLICLGGAVASASTLPQVTPVAVEKIFAPVGFDDNDRIQVVATGSFPNTCYKIGPYTTEIDEVQKQVRVRQTALYYSEGVCLRMLVPWAQTVELGILAEGSYKIEDGLVNHALARLPVTRASHSGPDDFLYAPVGDAYVVSDGPTQHTLSLSGTFTNRCTRIKEVRVHYYPDVIVVQPIAEMVTREECAVSLTRFHYEVKLEQELQGARLLHVRVMNGQAINKIVDFL